MLARTSYEQTYIDDCRRQIAEQVDAYQQLVAAAGPTAAGVVATFEPRFLANLVVVLDALFMHRQRSLEGKDGNPLNEVRMIAASVTGNGGVLAKDSTIKYEPGRAVLGLAIGDDITMDVVAFQRLAAAYVAEIARRYPA